MRSNGHRWVSTPLRHGKLSTVTIKTHTSAHSRPHAAAHAVVIVRVAADDPRWDTALECSQDHVKKGYRVQVFLHGQAVAPGLADPPAALRALDRDPSVDVVVCQAAWRRLGLADEPPLAVASLVGLWSTMQRTDLISVFGQGDWPAASGDWPSVAVAPPSPGVAWGVMVERGVDGQERQSLVEFVLAAAVLELDVAVAFGPQALGELSGESARGWAQLTDHDLAHVITTASDDARYHERHWLVL